MLNDHLKTFGGPFSSDGRLQGTEFIYTITCANGVCPVTMPAPSIAIVYLTTNAVSESEPSTTVTFGTTTTAVSIHHCTFFSLMRLNRHCNRLARQIRPRLHKPFCKHRTDGAEEIGKTLDPHPSGPSLTVHSVCMSRCQQPQCSALWRPSLVSDCYGACACNSPVDGALRTSAYY